MKSYFRNQFRINLFRFLYAEWHFWCKLMYAKNTLREPFKAWWIVGGRSSLERYGEGELNAASASVASARTLYFVKLHWRRNMNDILRAAIKDTINYCLNDRPQRHLLYFRSRKCHSLSRWSIGWATHEIKSPFYFGTPLLFPERILIMHKHILIDGGQCEHSLTDCGVRG